MAAALSQLASSGCGKKGPPLAPLRLAPAAMGQMDARRSGADVQLRFDLPTTNLNGPGPIDLDRVEIYAVTIGPGKSEPANRDLLSRERLVGSIAVRPPAVEGEGAATPAAPAPADTRPAPGDRVTFVEELTAAKLEPIATPAASGPASERPAVPEAPGTLEPAGGASKPVPGATPPTPGATLPAPGTALPGVASGVEQRPVVGGVVVPTRVYGIRGITRGGRPGQPVRVKVPLVQPPAPPTGVAARFTETAIALDWTPPVADVGGTPASFNVYPAAERVPAFNTTPLTAPAFEQPVAEYGHEQCFVVRTVQLVAGVPIESEPSAPACTTPRDIFPPPAPAGLQAVPAADGVSLSWDGSAAADLAGYILLRGEAPGDTLQPLTPEPIRETTYRDTTVKPGVTYVYAVVAVDKATPPNTSARSEPTTVTAR